MIEKRFIVDDSGYVVIDNNSEEAFMFDTIEDCYACCDLLNEQHETIQQSKELIKTYYNENSDLIKENDQLKQQIKDMKIRFKRKYDYEFDEIVDELW